MKLWRATTSCGYRRHGLYLRALVEGLAPGPLRDERLRHRLTAREKRRAGSVHRFCAASIR